MRKRNRTITIRCTDDEYERIHNKAQRYKLSLSDFVLGSALDKKIVVVDGLGEVAKQQKAIGRNLNQIAMKDGSTRSDWTCLLSSTRLSPKPFAT